MAEKKWNTNPVHRITIEMLELEGPDCDGKVDPISFYQFRYPRPEFPGVLTGQRKNYELNGSNS